MARRFVHVLHAADNVATALVDLEPGIELEVELTSSSTTGGRLPARRITVKSAIPFGHKVALAPIAAGQPVIKYGEVIGLTTAEIAPGEHVHIHNVESQRGRGDLARPDMR